MLPIESKLIHCRWTGESTWIPFGDFRPGIDYENHTSHPAPGMLAMYPGGISECEIFFPYGGVHDVLEGRPAGGQPLRHDRPGRGLAGPTARGRPALPCGMARSRSGSARRPSHRRLSNRRHRRDHRGDLACDRRLATSQPRPLTDLLVRGGTVVTAAGSRQADLAVDGGRITAIEPSLEGLTATADRVVDATGMLVLPGIVDVHTHTRVATDAEPDRFFQDSVAAAFGGTTDVPLVQQPRNGIVPGSRAVAADRPRRVARGDRGRQRDRPRALPGDLRPCRRPARRAARHDRCRGRHVEGVHGVRLPARRPALFDAMRVMSERGGMLQVHCEDPILLDAGIAGALERGETAPRFHARVRPAYVEAVATARALAFARATGAPLHVVHLSSAAALDEVRRAKAAGVRVTAETCPHYLVLTEEVYDEPDPIRCACYVISPPLRSAADRDALWAGLADGTLDLVATDHVPDRMAVEKAEAGAGVSFDRISNGAPGIETLLTLLYSEGVGRGRISPERMVELLSTAPAIRFGMPRKGALEVGRDADLVVFDPGARSDDPGCGPSPHQRLHPVRGGRGHRRRARRRRARGGRHPQRGIRGPARLRAVPGTRPGRGLNARPVDPREVRVVRRPRRSPCPACPADGASIGTGTSPPPGMGASPARRVAWSARPRSGTTRCA